MKRFYFFLSLAIFFSCSKKEDNFINQIGEWSGASTQVNTVDGVVTFENSVDFNLELEVDGEGIFSSIFGSDIEVHWVIDQAENEIFILREIPITGGGTSLSVEQFTINIDSELSQEWESLRTYINPTSGDEEKYLTEWILTKK